MKNLALHSLAWIGFLSLGLAWAGGKRSSDRSLMDNYRSNDQQQAGTTDSIGERRTIPKPVPGTDRMKADEHVKTNDDAANAAVSGSSRSAERSSSGAIGGSGTVGGFHGTAGSAGVGPANG